MYMVQYYYQNGEILSNENFKHTHSIPSDTEDAVWSKTGSKTFYTSGNVGISTNNPSYPLHVNDDLVVENMKMSGNTISALNSGGLALKDDNHNLGIQIKDGGNVGVGQSDPAYKLDISGDVNFTGDLRKSGTVVNIGSEWSKTGSEIYYTGGNVGIGTNNPDKLLTLHAPSGDCVLKIRADPSNNNEGDVPMIIFAQDGNIEATAIGTEGTETSNALCFWNSVVDGGIKFFTSNTNGYANGIQRFDINHDGKATLGLENSTNTVKERKFQVLEQTGSVRQALRVKVDGDLALEYVVQNNDSATKTTFLDIHATASNFLHIRDQLASNTILTVDGSNQRIGIKDTTPSYALDVNGDINLTGSLRINGTTQSFGGVFTESNSEAYYTGNVGIGTTNPGSRIHVHNSSSGIAHVADIHLTTGYTGTHNNNDGLKIVSAGGGARFEWRESSVIKWYYGGAYNLYMTTDGDLEFQSTGKSVILKSADGTKYRITVDNSGNLGTETV
tara:strand:+ start:6372 stop:7877 length:1506 start_codon:yes stop_codon:yes gene_type:complete